jgi:methenyltetrahydromethanopterin cyclohydrolase
LGIFNQMMPPVDLELNQLAALLCQRFAVRAEALQIATRTLGCETRIIDCGVQAAGSIEAGLLLARVCLADLAEMSLQEVADEVWPQRSTAVVMPPHSMV